MNKFERIRKRLKDTLPDNSKFLKFDGIESDIEIYRDSYGIPHVKAKSIRDCFFGQGFVTAQDRLWHMEHDRRMAYGRWSEIVGDEAIEQDKLMRRFQIMSSVSADYRCINSNARLMLDSYASGVNAFIDTTSDLSIEFELVGIQPDKWLPQDSLAVFKARHILMGVFEGKLWRAKLVEKLGVEKATQIITDYPLGHPLITPVGEVYSGGDWDVLDQLELPSHEIDWFSDSDGGSNNWAIMGNRTASGSPILAGDPHRPLDTPNVYYQNHIQCDEFNVIGLSFPGCPGFPHFGHNANVAWCVTHAQADYQDLYIEKFNHVFEYQWKGTWKNADIRHETIESRTGTITELDVVVTHHGPIIIDKISEGYGIALKHTAISGPNNWSESLFDMLLSRSVDQMDEAMRNWVDPVNNFLFADISGDVQYLTRGRLPIRPPLNGWIPVPGWTGNYEWDRFIPFDEQVRFRNPDVGYMATANNKIASDDYPYYIALHFHPGYRAQRIQEKLAKLNSATIEDMAQIHQDAVSIPAQVYMKIIEEISPLDQSSDWAKTVLGDWDGVMDQASIAPTIYSAFRRELESKLLEYQLGLLTEDALASGGRGAPMHVTQLRAKFVTAAASGDVSVIPKGLDWKTVAACALSKGVKWLKDTFGEDVNSWHWGAVHRTKPKHVLSTLFPELATILNPPSVQMSGDGDTTQAAWHTHDDPFDVVGLSVARYIFDLNNWENSCWITPLGVSGHPGSPHYTDQVSIWANGDMVPMLYSWDKIKNCHATYQKLSRIK